MEDKQMPTQVNRLAMVVKFKNQPKTVAEPLPTAK